MVWIDWNQNGDFNDSGESFNLGSAYSVSNGATTNSPFSINVPSTAYNGSTRMRVSMKYNSSPGSCDTNNDGEVEDYSVTVSGGVTPSPTHYIIHSQ